MKQIIGIFTAIALLAACGGKTQVNSDMVNNPLTADGKIDTANMAQIGFSEEVFDFGKIKAGEKVTHTFIFTNTGKTDLIVTEVSPSCGCTATEWTKEPIPAGKTGQIDIIFNSTGKKGQQNKSVTVLANTIPNQKILFLRGEVE